MSRKTILSVATAAALSFAASAQAQGLPVQQIPGGADAVYADVTVASGPTVNLAQLAPAQTAGPVGYGQPVYDANLAPAAANPYGVPQAAPFGQGYGQITNVQPMAIPAIGGSVSAVVPQAATAYTTTTIQPAPVVAGQQAQNYTPTYYYYYYQQPYQVTQMAAPVVYVDPAAVAAAQSGYANQFGPMTNARGESGHVRYPYYSYRRPWFFPGQPSFNVTIDGPVW